MSLNLKLIKLYFQNKIDDSAALVSKEQELAKVQNLFQKLKDADIADNEAFQASQKKFEAVSAGMEVNEDGEAATLQEQLMSQYYISIFFLYHFLYFALFRRQTRSCSS